MNRFFGWANPFRLPPPPVHRCIAVGCDQPSEPQDGPFCPNHDWTNYATPSPDPEPQAESETEALKRILDAAEELSSAAAYKLARAAGSVHPCELEGCPLSQEEHHRLAYGFMNENRELRKRIAELEGGTS